jgi:hypothetical protein
MERPPPKSTARPERPSPRALADGVQCPFCSRNETELVTPFGGQLSVAQYWCRVCRTGFDYLKWSRF